MISWEKLLKVAPKEINKILGEAHHRSFPHTYSTGDMKQMLEVNKIPRLQPHLERGRIPM